MNSNRYVKYQGVLEGRRTVVIQSDDGSFVRIREGFKFWHECLKNAMRMGLVNITDEQYHELCRHERRLPAEEVFHADGTVEVNENLITTAERKVADDDI